MTDVIIEPMNITHIGEILEIEDAVFPTPWTRDMFERELTREAGPTGPRTHAVVVTRADRVIGYAIAWLLPEELHLVNIAIHDEFQERGIGSRLLNHVIDTACGLGKVIITLEVRRSNTVAQAFYRGFGFETIGVRCGYYSDNREDAVLMALDLGHPIERRRLDAKESQFD